MAEVNLNDFFAAVNEEKKRQKEELEELISGSFDEMFLRPLRKKTRKKVKKVPEISEEIKAPEVSTLVERSLGLLAEPSDKKIQNDPLTPLDQNFVAKEDLQNHYRLFLQRIQQQLSTIGGGGEVRLERLDDVDRVSAKQDNYFLKYSATLNKWIGDSGGGVGITSVILITGITTYYNANKDVDYIGVSADVPVTIQLPNNPDLGKQIIIKDEGNKIEENPITIRAGIGASVENSDSVVMKINHESLTYFYNGLNWYLI